PGLPAAVVDLERADDAIEDAAIRAELLLRRDGDRVQQIPVTHLRRHDLNVLSAAGLRPVGEHRSQPGAIADLDAVESRRPTEIRVAARERVEQLLRRRLQIVRLVAAVAELDAVREHVLAVRVAVCAFGREGHAARAALQLTPVRGYADAKQIAFVVGAEARCRRLDAAGGNTRSAAAGPGRPTRVSRRVFRGRRARQLLEVRLDLLERARIAHRILDAQRLRFTRDVFDTIAGIRVIAQPLRSARAALLLDRAEHVRHLARVVAGARHDVRPFDVRLPLVLAAEAEERGAEPELRAL